MAVGRDEGKGRGPEGESLAEVLASIRALVTAETAARIGVELVTLEQLYPRADYVTIHTPLTPETRGLVGRDAIAKMKKGVRIVNCARGGIVDEAALAHALRAGRLAGAASDVASREPIDPANPLLTAPRMILTPHMAWASLAARRRLLATSVANVRAPST